MKMPAVKITGAVIAAGVLLVGCASLNPFKDPDERWANYKSWTKITEGEPSTGASVGLGDVHKGPEGYRDVFVNKVGEAMLVGDGPYDFPAGTVIVKEQYDDKAGWESGKGGGLTVSVKTADSDGTPGTDWIWATGYTATAGESAFCSGCHSAAVQLGQSDFVFSVPKYLEAN